jgi:hypothetical protein
MERVRLLHPPLDPPQTERNGLQGDCYAQADQVMTALDLIACNATVDDIALASRLSPNFIWALACRSVFGRDRDSDV